MFTLYVAGCLQKVVYVCKNHLTVKVFLSFSICVCCISQTKTYKRWKTTAMTRIALNILDDQQIRDAIRYDNFSASETGSVEHNLQEYNPEVSLLIIQILTSEALKLFACRAWMTLVSTPRGVSRERRKLTSFYILTYVKFYWTTFSDFIIILLF